jgi:rubrerythrin
VNTENHSNNNLITEDMIFECFAAAKKDDESANTAKSFVDVEEYENQVMYPEFSRWAQKAGFPKIAKLFLHVAKEEGQHSVWLRELYQTMGAVPTGEDTHRAKSAIATIKENCDKLLKTNPKGVVERALKVAIRVEEREYKEIYPHFRDQALSEGNQKAAGVYQRVIDSEREHASWFKAALDQLQLGSSSEISALA